VAFLCEFCQGTDFWELGCAHCTYQCVPSVFLTCVTDFLRILQDALADIFVLSFCHFVLTSQFSTFGYVALALRAARYTRTHARAHTHTHAQTHTHTHTHTNTHMHICICICICTYIRIFIYLYICICIHTQTQTHSSFSLPLSLSLSLSLSRTHTHTLHTYIHTYRPAALNTWLVPVEAPHESRLCANRPQVLKKKNSHEGQCTALILISLRILAGRNVKESSLRPPFALLSTRQVVILHSFLVLFLFFILLLCYGWGVAGVV
jgi:hypothetical protein